MKCWNLKNHYAIQIQAILFGVPGYIIMWYHHGIIDCFRFLVEANVDTDAQIVITHIVWSTLAIQVKCVTKGTWQT